MSSEPKIYDLDTYQPANCVGQLIYRVRAAHMNALDEVLAKDPDAATDALRRSLIVSGDTHYTNACGLAAGHGITYFWSRRVKHTDQ